jgi:putative ABC transport system permease protein
MGIVFSVVLVMVQAGLYFGFSGMITTVIDHTSTDLWIVSSGAKYFEDLSLLNAGMRDRLLAVEGVSEVVPGVVGFSAWSRRTVSLECRGRDRPEFDYSWNGGNRSVLL